MLVWLVLRSLSKAQDRMAYDMTTVGGRAKHCANSKLPERFFAVHLPIQLLVLIPRPPPVQNE